MDQPPQIHSLPETMPLAQTIAGGLGAELAPAELRVFEDREFKLRPGTDPAGRHCVVIACLHGDRMRSPQDRFMQLLFLVAALRDHRARRIDLLLPYLAYARKDRRTQPLDSLSLRYAAQLIEAAGADSVSTLEAHSLPAFDNAFRIPAHSLPGHALLAAAVRDQLGDALRDDALVVASPDAGGIKRAQLWRETLSGAPPRSAGRATASTQRATIGFANLIKRRSLGHLSGQETVCGEVGQRVVLLVDDLIVSGSTLARAARALVTAGAAQVIAVVTHDLRATGALARLGEAGISRLITSDSVPEPGDDIDMNAPIRRERIACADALAALVRRAAGEGPAARWAIPGGSDPAGTMAP